MGGESRDWEGGREGGREEISIITGSPLILLTPMGQKKVSLLVRCPLFRG